MAGAAGPGGRAGRIINSDLIKMIAIADNIHDFSSERGGIQISEVIGDRLDDNRYYRNLMDIIGRARYKSNNFEKMVQQFLEENFFELKVSNIYNFNSPEHTRFIDCSDNDSKELEKVKGRDYVSFRVLVSRDNYNNKYIDYINRENLILGLNLFFGLSKNNIDGKEYLPIIYDASSFSPKNIFYFLDERSESKVKGIFGGILVEESSHNDSATKIKNSNFYPECKSLVFSKLLDGETLTYTLSDNKPIRKAIKLLVNHSNILENQMIEMRENIQELKNIDRIFKVEIPSSNNFQYYLTNTNSYCNSILIIVSPTGKKVAIKMSVFMDIPEFSVGSISSYYRKEVENPLYDSIFAILGISNIVTKFQILMDLKRCGDWSQVMMIKQSGKKAVLYTHDRMLFNFARIQNVPVIFTSFPNVNNEEEDNNSLYVDLVCYTPDVNGKIDENIANMIALAKREVVLDELRNGLETLKRYREKLINYFLKETFTNPIPGTLNELNMKLNRLVSIRTDVELVNIRGGIPLNLQILYKMIDLLVNLINYSYKILIEFIGEIENIEGLLRLSRLRVNEIRDRLNRQFSNYNVLIAMKTTKLIAKNFSLLFSEEREDFKIKTSDITNIVTSLFLGVNLNTLFNNILYSLVYNLREPNPQFTYANFLNFLRVMVQPIKTLIESNQEISEEIRIELDFNNEDRIMDYLGIVSNLTRLNTAELDTLYRNINYYKPKVEIIGGGIEYILEGYIALDNVKVYYYTYLSRMLIDALKINDEDQKRKLIEVIYRLGLDYNDILGIIRGNIVENGEVRREIVERMKIDWIKRIMPEDIREKPNLRLLCYTVLVNELLKNPNNEEILELIEYLQLVYSDNLGICSINIVKGDAVNDKVKPIIVYDEIGEKIDIGSKIEEVEPIEVYGGKIRIKKNSMRNIYLDDLEKNIIRWAIKKGYIHKSNYLDLQKLLNE